MDEIQRLKKIVARLRGPDGCPWDQKQTHQSLTECLIEECAELLDSIDHNDVENMCEELGDVLLQVVMHAQLAEESNGFDLHTVATKLNEKLIRRHPHVFGDKIITESDEVLAQWDAIKSKEKKGRSNHSQYFKSLPPRLPSLLYARDVYKQVVKAGINTEGVLDGDKISEQGKKLSDLEAGALLFDIVAACRQANIDPESALRRYADHVIKKLENAQSQKRDL